MLKLAFTIMLGLAPWAYGQTLDASFYLSKEKYLVGEPIYLLYEVTNKDRDPVRVLTTSPYSFCAGYDLGIEGVRRTDRPACGPWGIAGSCVSSTQVLKFGEKKIERILLNETFQFEEAGTYILQAKRMLPYGPAGDEVYPLSVGSPRLETEARIEIVLEATDTDKLKPVFEPYVKSLHSGKGEERIEAARVISDLAPAFLEPLILELARSPENRGMAVRGLRGLNTPAARGALAEMIDASKKGHSPHEEAIRYLGEMGDRSYLPMLMEVARSAEPNTSTHQVAVTAVAELGRKESLPFLLQLLNSGNEFAQFNAVSALPRTGVRAAAPALIAMLQSRNSNMRNSAASGLVQLTHRSPTGRWPYEQPEATGSYQAWFRWWALNGDTAPIYSSRECGDIRPFE